MTPSDKVWTEIESIRSELDGADYGDPTQARRIDYLERRLEALSEDGIDHVIRPPRGEVTKYG